MTTMSGGWGSVPAQVAPNIMSSVDCTCLHDMDVEGVAAWFRELGLPQYVPAVQQNGIDGLVMANMLCQGTMLSVLSMTQPLHMSKVSAGVMRLNRKRGLGQEEGAAAQAADKRPRTAAEEMMDEGEKVVSKSSEHGVLVYARRPNRELECAVCLEAVPNEPSMLRNLACDHFSCKTCLLAALRRNRMCPQCRKPADLPDNPGAAVEDLIMLARLPAAMVDALPVHCPRGVVESRRDGQAEWSASSYAVEGGCKAIVLRGELDSHLAVCGYEKVPCQHSKLGCTHTMLRKDSAAHTAQCWYALGKNHLEEWQGKFASLQEKMETKSSEYDKKMAEYEEKLSKNATDVAVNTTNLAVVRAQNSRLGALARELVQERAQGDPSLFGGALAPLPAPDPDRLKRFVHDELSPRSTSANWTYAQDDDGTVSISLAEYARDFNWEKSTGKQLTELASLLPLCPTITKLDLRGAKNYVSNEPVAALIRSLPQLIMLKELHLRLDQDGLRRLAKVLPQMRSLRTLEIDANEVSCEKAEKESIKLMPMKKQQHLQLQASRPEMRPMKKPEVVFDGASTRAFSSGLARCPWLEDVRLTACKFDTDGFRSLSRALAKLTALKTVCLANGVITDLRRIGDNCWITFFTALSECKNLTALTVEYVRTVTGIGDSHSMKLPLSAIPALSNLLAKAPLIELELCESSIEAPQMIKICELLVQCKSLETIRFGENEMETAMFEAVADSLPQLTNLKHLLFYSGEAGDAGAMAIARALPDCKALESLEMGSLDIDEQGLTAIFNALCRSVRC